MNFPKIFSFEVVYYIDGKLISPLPKDHIVELEKYDPYLSVRLKCADAIDKDYIQRLILLLKLHNVYSCVLLQQKNNTSLDGNLFLNDALLLNIVEGAAKQYISDLDALMKNFIKLLDMYMGKHSNLFKKNAQKKLIEMGISGNSEKAIALRQKNDTINVKRNELFLDFNSQEIPTNKSFTHLKDRVSKLRDLINPYRDQVASHPERDIELSCKDVAKCTAEFTQIVFDFYEVVSFNYPPTTKKAGGIDSQVTTKYLIDGIFVKK